MIKAICKLTLFTLPLLCTSCIKEGYDAANCPGEYTIVPFYPDLSETGNSEIPNTTINIIDADGNQQTVQAGSNQPVDLEDGTYTIVAVENPDKSKVTIDRTDVGIATNPDGTAMDVPENLVGGHTDITTGGTTADQGNVNFDIPTYIQSRPLVIKLAFEGANTSLIQGIDGKVTGIALSRDLNHGFAPIDGEDRHPAIRTGGINYTFAPDETATGRYSDSHRLLGISGPDNQALSFTITYEGGVQKTYEYDITRDMDGFHTKDVLTPWVIQITLRLGADLTADIVDWEAGSETGMDAH